MDRFTSYFGADERIKEIIKDSKSIGKVKYYNGIITSNLRVHRVDPDIIKAYETSSWSKF